MLWKNEFDIHISIAFIFIYLGFTVVSCIGYLKGVFAKNERGYRLNAIKKRF